MNDKEFIKYLVSLLADDLTDVNTPSDEDLKLVEAELKDRKIDFDKYFGA